MIARLNPSIEFLVGELERLATFLDQVQLRDATFGSLMQSVARLKRQLNEIVATSSPISPISHSRAARRVSSVPSVEMAECIGLFRRRVTSRFQRALNENFYQDARVAAFSQAAQILDPTHTRVG